MTVLLEAIDELTCVLEAGSRNPRQRNRDVALAKLQVKVLRALHSRFRAQRKSVLGSSTLRKYFTSLPAKEADTEIADQMAAVLTGEVVGLTVNPKDAALFNAAMAKALQAGAGSYGGTVGESFEAEYLKDAGFQRLTGQIDKTTVDRLATAIANAYEDGADFDGVLSAIRSEFADMSAVRAKMIAQTELNDAFAQGSLEFGRQSGAEFKSWEVDTNPCVICIENANAGPIELESDFPSGDDAPTAHPNCECSLMVHA